MHSRSFNNCLVVGRQIMLSRIMAESEAAGEMNTEVEKSSSSSSSSSFSLLKTDKTQLHRTRLQK